MIWDCCYVSSKFAIPRSTYIHIFESIVRLMTASRVQLLHACSNFAYAVPSSAHFIEHERSLLSSRVNVAHGRKTKIRFQQEIVTVMLRECEKRDIFGHGNLTWLLLETERFALQCFKKAKFCQTLKPARRIVTGGLVRGECLFWGNFCGD